MSNIAKPIGNTVAFPNNTGPEHEVKARYSKDSLIADVLREA